MTTRQQAVSALVAGFVAAVLALAWAFSDDGAGGDGGGGRVSAASIEDPLAEALRYIPRSATAVAAIDTDLGGGPLGRAIEVVGGVTSDTDLAQQADELLTGGTGLSLASDGPALAGAPLVVAATGSTTRPKLLAAIVAGDPAAVSGVLSAKVGDGSFAAADSYRGATTYRRTEGAGFYAQDGRLLLAAADQATLRKALDRGVNRGAAAATGLSLGAFTSKAASGVSSKDAVARVAIEGPLLRRLLARVVPNAGQLPLLAGVTGAGLGVRTDASGLHVRLRLRLDESLVTETDLPLAPGAEPPDLSGDASLRIGLRSPAQTGAFLLRSLRLLAPERLKRYEEVTAIFARVARVDPENDLLSTLTGPATLSADDGASVTFRAEVDDETKVRGVLQRLAGLGRIGNYTGAIPLGEVVPSLALRRAESGDPDTYEVVRDDAPVAIVALRGDVLVVSADPFADVESLATGEDAGEVPRGTGGALKLVGVPTAVIDLLGLPERVRELADLAGNTVLTARSELTAITIGLDLGLDG